MTQIATLYVNPVTGNDANTGMRGTPFKSLTHALRRTPTPAIIRLAPGTYNAANGERFPLVIPEGVMVVGNETNKGLGIVINGSGDYDSLTFGIQSVTLTLLDDASLLGVTVTNPAPKGTGVWIESTSPIVANNTLTNCGREGIFVTGTAKPLIRDNAIARNGSGGLVFAKASKGEFLRNLVRKNPIGLAITDSAAPLVVNNQITENKVAIAVAQQTRPVLRSNAIVQNSDGGLLVNGNALPDMGNIHDPAENKFSANTQFDVFNNTSYTLTFVGNDVNPSLIRGQVNFAAAQVELRGEGNHSGYFSDLGGHWASDFIEALAAQGLVSGAPDGNFNPTAAINRAEYAALITKVFQLETSTRGARFSDVPNSFWAAGAIAAAVNRGFLTGFPDGTFRPQQNLTKTQAVVSIVGGLRLSGGNANLLSMYRDRSQIPSFAVNAIASATQNLLVVNYPEWDLLEPQRDITRSEIAATIYQALVTQGKIKPIRSPYIVLPNTELPTFTDIQGHWAEEFIRGLASLKLINGLADGRFAPEQPMNRAQYASLISNAFNPSPKRNPSKFLDVPRNFWANEAIQRSEAAGFVGGFSDRTFRPDQNVQRLQIIISLVVGLSLTSEKQINLANLYQDITSVPTNIHPAIAIATNHRIIVNYPNPKQLLPQKEATRAEVAALVYQALVAIGRIPTVDSQYIVLVWSNSELADMYCIH